MVTYNLFWKNHQMRLELASKHCEIELAVVNALHRKPKMSLLFAKKSFKIPL